jgi:hypothetical protein
MVIFNCQPLPVVCGFVLFPITGENDHEGEQIVSVQRNQNLNSTKDLHSAKIGCRICGAVVCMACACRRDIPIDEDMNV